MTIGLCELETPVPIEPGRGGRGTLIFDERVASEALQAAKEGVAFEMAEGDHVVATARVLTGR